MPRRYSKGKLVYVETTVKVGTISQKINYVYRTTIPSAYYNRFGINDIETSHLNDNTFLSRAVFQPNNIKPPKATIVLSDGTTISSFVDDDKLDNLEDDSDVTNIVPGIYEPPGERGNNSASLLVTCSLTFPGTSAGETGQQQTTGTGVLPFKYAWYVPSKFVVSSGSSSFSGDTGTLLSSLIKQLDIHRGNDILTDAIYVIGTKYPRPPYRIKIILGRSSTQTGQTGTTTTPNKITFSSFSPYPEPKEQGAVSGYTISRFKVTRTKGSPGRQGFMEATRFKG